MVTGTIRSCRSAGEISQVILTRLLNSSRHAANGTITYRYKNLNTTLKLNWTGVRKTAAAPLAGVSNAGWAAYQTDVFRTDVDVNYMLTRAATLFATCRNIFDEPNVTYWQSPGSPKIGTRWFHSGAIIQMGVKGTF